MSAFSAATSRPPLLSNLRLDLGKVDFVTLARNREGRITGKRQVAMVAMNLATVPMHVTSANIRARSSAVSLALQDKTIFRMPRRSEADQAAKRST